MPTYESAIAFGSNVSEASSSTAAPGLDAWLADWGQWLNLWQRDDGHEPDSTAVKALLDWKSTLPEKSFGELHEMLDQLLQESTSRTERTAILQTLKSWQRTMLRLHNQAQAARV